MKKETKEMIIAVGILFLLSPMIVFGIIKYFVGSERLVGTSWGYAYKRKSNFSWK